MAGLHRRNLRLASIPELRINPDSPGTDSQIISIGKPRLRRVELLLLLDCAAVVADTNAFTDAAIENCECAYQRAADDRKNRLYSGHC